MPETPAARNRRAERIAAGRGDAVLDAALSVGGVGVLAVARAPAVLLGALVQVSVAPAEWRAASGWQRGEHGLQACLPRVQVDGEPDQSVLLRAGDPDWTGAALPATAAGPDVWRGALAAPMADAGRPLADVVIEWLRDVPAGGLGVSALAVVVEYSGLGESVDAYRPVHRGSLPALERGAGPGEIRDLPNLRADDAPYLPGLDPMGSASGCPSWLLAAFDAGGGASLSQGRGASWVLRLWIAALLHVPIEKRNGQPVALTFPVRDVAAWLHPDGWRNRRRDWDRLPAALAGLGSLRVPIEVLATAAGDREFRPVALVSCPALPSEWRGGEALVVLDVRVPAAAAHGSRIDWRALCRYGSDSASAYRAFLAVSAVLHRTAYRGAPVTRQIGAPVLRSDGKPKRRKGGALVRDPGALVDHPHAGKAAAWSDHDAARFLGFDPTDKRRRHDARRAIERLAGDGVIDLQRDSSGRFRLFGPAR